MKLSALAACSLVMLTRVATSAEPVAPTPPPRDTVILLHGLGRTQLSLILVARALERDGFHVVNLTYRWRARTLEDLATHWLPEKITELVPAARASADAPRLHFVTHSMGAILVRLWLEKNPPPPHLGRVVMLAPPNQGSELADHLGAHRALHWLVGPNGPRLGTTPNALPATLAPWPAHLADLGVLAGDVRLLPFLDRVLPPPHDGKVTVASTHLAGERAHRTLPVSHTFIPWTRETHAHVAAFLRTGAFPVDPAKPNLNPLR